MSNRSKTLLIGKSLIIKKAIFSLFKNHKITNLSFRKSWTKPNSIKKFKYIIVSGFHFDICKMQKRELDKYVIEYFQYINKIKKKCQKVYLICTDMNFSYSFSRVVYFYFNLLKKIRKDRKLEVLSFKYLYSDEKNIMNSIKIFILKILGYDLLLYKDLKKGVNTSLFNKKKIKFYFIKLPRTRFFDRLIRLFIDTFLIKNINKFF